MSSYWGRWSTGNVAPVKCYTYLFKEKQTPYLFVVIFLPFTIFVEVDIDLKLPIPLPPNAVDEKEVRPP